MDFLKLTKDKLVVSDLSDLVAHESCGAISLFVGTTRDYFEDKKVISLEYEAYEPMALKTLKNICQDIRSRWPQVKNIGIYHRLGEVAVKEASVVIAISSPHRKDGIEATAFAIEELKKQVPIWKKEQYLESQAKTERRTGRKIDFRECPVEGVDVPKHLVQIGTNHEEISRRIEMFIERKRQEVNTSNIEDFIEGDVSESCARVKCTVFRVKDSKGHLKVRRVQNEFGPQTLSENYTKLFTKLQESPSHGSSETKEAPSTENIKDFGVKERLSDMEKHLALTSVQSGNVFQRIKALEDRILYLESISPEYIHFLERKSQKPGEKREVKRKRIYSIQCIDDFIAELEENP
ncbi:molybdopterin synthase catalytic subunit isoform X1 [Phlebotomus papatasi]|uniref:molybdopterin synthase catalytic subunit isoform X1 n=1 Tax=Phlebotomus papatasi TaxID=29031 RepID=UPI0024840655|nr:molybdopterin synthase catalytic subunit isoform X1 [Phlebotomus papatasi]